MQRSLFAKYFAICSAIIISSFVILGAVFLLFASQYFNTDRRRLLANHAQQALAMTAANLVVAYNNNGMNWILDEYPLKSGYIILARALDSTIFLTDQEGNTKICSEDTECIHRTLQVSEEVLHSIEQNGSYYEIGRLGGIYSKPYHIVALPLRLPEPYNTTIGIVFVASPADDLTGFLSEMFSLFVLSATAVLLLAFVIIYFLTNRMVRPLRRMAVAAKNFSQGDFSMRIPVEGYDEIGQLASAFNNMANALADLEAVRRSFIANVSHELKTPMTTISGFIDGILDGTIPEDRRDHYLHIVSDETKRLSRLVKSMLNIARIEAGETRIIVSSVDLHDLVLRTVFTFEQSIENKNIELRGLDEGKVMVEADSDLIHQVIYNLIDNAVKFTPDDGYIDFRFTTDGDMVYVAIRNSGSGIPEPELNRLFDRFYKSDKSRSLDKNGVGLGLYIVKTVLNLHGGNIAARSAEGEYSEFEFSLPLSRENQPASRESDLPIPKNDGGSLV